MSDFLKDWVMYEFDGDFVVLEMMCEVKVVLKNMFLFEVWMLLKVKIEFVGISYGEIYDLEVCNKIESYLIFWVCEVYEFNDIWNILFCFYWSL